MKKKMKSSLIVKLVSLVTLSVIVCLIALGASLNYFAKEQLKESTYALLNQQVNGEATEISNWITETTTKLKLMASNSSYIDMDKPAIDKIFVTIQSPNQKLKFETD